VVALSSILLMGPRVSVVEIRWVDRCPCLEDVESRVLEIPAAMVEDCMRTKPPTKRHAPTGCLFVVEMPMAVVLGGFYGFVKARKG